MFMQLGKYKHFKGGMCEVIGIARHSETLKKLVVYRALYDSKEFGMDSLWVRPEDMFLEEIEVDGKIMKRFKFVGCF